MAKKQSKKPAKRGKSLSGRSDSPLSTSSQEVCKHKKSFFNGVIEVGNIKQYFCPSCNDIVYDEADL